MNLHAKTLLVIVFVWLTFLPCRADVCGYPFWRYCQEFDHTGNAYSSQNDNNGLGLFAQVYDNFRIDGSAVSGIRFEGEYFNPPNPGPITGWTAGLYADNDGQPGAVLFTQHIAGTGQETFDGNFGGFPAYIYTFDLPVWSVNPGTQYWISVVPDLGFPPQWGWSSGLGGDGISYQDFFGARSQLAADMAFALNGCRGCVCGFCDDAPEPGTLLMLGTGAAASGALGGEILGVSLLGVLRSLIAKHR